MPTKLRVVDTGLAVLLGIGLPLTGGSAQTRSSDEPTPTTNADIVVTAERRVTRLQDTPVAVTAFDAQSIERNRIQSLRDVALRTPSMTYTQFSNQESYISIRGTLINNNAAGWDDAVATFIDDVPTTGLGDANPDLFDLQSIEVLRGPQGTLFGRNATGGAVVIHTLAPSFTPNGRVEVTYGADNLAEARGYYTAPLSDTVAGKLSGDIMHRDGYFHNITLNNDAGRIDRADVRGQLLLKAGGDVDVTLSGDYLRDRSGGYPTRLLGQFAPALFPGLRYGPSVTNQAINGYQHRDIAGASLRVVWDTSHGVLTSISGVRYVNGRFPNTVLGDPQNELPTRGTLRDLQFTQEVRFTSPSSSRLSYVVGVFGLHANKRQAASLRFQFNPLTVAGLFSGANNYDQFSAQRIAVDSVAVFGEANYDLLPTLRLTVGARESYEHKDGNTAISFNSANPSLIPGAADYSHGWNSFVPKVMVSWRPSTSLLLYATASKGFKSGGYDLAASGGATSADLSAALATPFAPETVWNYEGGEKLTLLGGRVVLNADMFDDEYTNLQTPQLVQINDHPVQITTSSGNARVWGLELEASAQVLRSLQTGLTYTYSNTHFTSRGTSYEGNHIPYAPKHALHLFAEYSRTLPRGDAIALGVDDTIRSKVFFDVGNSAPAFLQDQSRWRSIVNAHLDYAFPSHIKVSAWGKNLTNDRPATHASDVTVLFENLAEFQSGPGSIFLTKFIEPRVYGVSLTIPLS